MRWLCIRIARSVGDSPRNRQHRRACLATEHNP
jgi:hypothetical protein